MVASRRGMCSLVAIATLAITFGSAPAALSRGVSSYALVEEDASLIIRGRTYRLYGIFIPQTERRCRTNQRPVRCGSRAALALEFRKGAHFVHCDPQWENDDRSITALCSVEGEDLSAYLLRQGWAVALPYAPFEYGVLEQLARHRSLGVWGFPIDRIDRRN